MNSLLKKILLNALSIFLFSQSIINSREASPLDAYIADSYLHATFGPTQPVKKNKQEAKKKNRFNLPQFKEKTITQRERQEIAFNIISSHDQQLQTDVTIDKTFINKMELVAGGENGGKHLASKLFEHMNTTLGKSWSAMQLTKPTTSTEQIQRRQKAVQLLLNNPQLLNELDSLLGKLSKTESQLLSFWHQKALNEQLIKFVYFNKWFEKFNTNTAMLEISNKFFDTIIILLGTIGSLTAVGIQPVFSTKYRLDAMDGRNHSFLEAIKVTRDLFLDEVKNNNIFKIGLSTLIAYQGLSTYLLFGTLKNKINLGKHLQNNLIGASSYLHNTKNIKQLITKNNELLQAAPAFEHIINLDNSNHHSAQFNKLLGMLKTNTFKGKPSVFSITGRIFAAHKLMAMVKNEFIPMLNAIAELDTYVALTKLYKNQQNTASYAFVEFKKSDQPYLQAINFWNPFIDPQTVVANTIHLDQYNGQNVILTGPNTGGKSTVIKSLLINILFAQTFGIAAAEKFIFTPFKKLNCYLNITDDISAGVSLFKAEVLRAKELLNTFKALPSDDFCFTIIDEAFSGTSPQEGEYASYKFAEQLGDFSNGITLIATHYPKLIDLEQEKPGTFKNYHVEVIRHENGSLQRTFKLLPDASRINIAFDILKEEGIF
jgi:DNA mismatch repair protein MutS